MNRKHESLDCLAQRVAQGDSGARGQFDKALEPYLARIVRRALAKGQPQSSLVRKIESVATRLDPDAQRRSNPRLTDEVADCIRQTLLCRLWSGGSEVTSGLSTVA